VVEDPSRNFGFDGDPSVYCDMAQDPPDPVQVRDSIPIRLPRFELDGHARGIEREPAFHGGNQVVAALTGRRRHAQRSRMERPYACAFGFGNGIALVEDIDNRHTIRFNFGEDALDGSDMAVSFRIRRINDVQQQICRRHLLERGAERRHERVRKPLDESDRIRDKQLSSIRQSHFSHEWIERHE
jgi:hypothetical protein